MIQSFASYNMPKVQVTTPHQICRRPTDPPSTDPGALSTDAVAPPTLSTYQSAPSTLLLKLGPASTIPDPWPAPAAAHKKNWV